MAEVKALQATSEDEIQDDVKDADGLLVWHTLQISPKTIQILDKCKIIARYGVGYDNVDLRAAALRKIFVTNVPDYCVEEATDHAFTLLSSMLRRIHLLDCAVKRGRWDHKISEGVKRFSRLTLGILGLGRIGTALALRAKAFGFRVIEYDSYIPSGKEKSIGVEAVEFEDLLRRSDVISIHTPLTDETRHMIGEQQLKMMKPNAILINTARGPIIEPKALYKALSEKWILWCSTRRT